jgi:hypothetical protein
MARYIDDTTSLDYAERQDQEWLREEQAQWFEEFRTEAELCCYFPRRSHSSAPSTCRRTSRSEKRHAHWEPGASAPGNRFGRASSGAPITRRH